MGVKICPNCGQKVSESRMDCIHCGYVFTPSKKCPDCDKEVPLDTVECPECGHIFEIEKQNVGEQEAIKENSSKTKADDKKQCPYCGSSELIEIGVGAFMCPACRNRVLIPSGEFAPLPTFSNAKSNEKTKQKSEDASLDNENEEQAPVRRKVGERALTITFSIVAALFALASVLLLAISPLGISDDGKGCVSDSDYIYLFRQGYSSAIISFVFAVLAFVTSVVAIILIIRNGKKRMPVGQLVCNVLIALLSLFSAFAFYYIKPESINKTWYRYDSTISGPLVVVMLFLAIVFAFVLIGYLINRMIGKHRYAKGVELLDVFEHVLTAMFASACLALITSSVILYYGYHNGLFLFDDFERTNDLTLCYIFFLISTILSLGSLLVLSSRSKIANIITLGLDGVVGILSLIAVIIFFKIPSSMEPLMRTDSNNSVYYVNAHFSVAGNILVPLMYVTMGLAFLGIVIKLLFILIPKKKNESEESK